jgi:hypothetical protein
MDQQPTSLLEATLIAPAIVTVLLRQDEIVQVIPGEEPDQKKAIRLLLPYLAIPVEEQAYTLRSDLPLAFQGLMRYLKAWAVLTAGDPSVFCFIPESRAFANRWRVHMRDALVKCSV